MRTSLQSMFRLFLLLSACVSASAAWSQDSDIRFTSPVLGISQTDTGEGTVTITAEGVPVQIGVNRDTEIEVGGEEVDLSGLSVDDVVKVDAFFRADGGLGAREITVLNRRGEQFRLNGLIDALTEVDATTTAVTIMGVDVIVDDDTRIIARGMGGGNSVTVAELAVGEQINAVGRLRDEQLHATRVHIGTRSPGEIELSGLITTLDSDSLVLNMRRGGAATVLFNTNTAVSGELAEGAFIEVEGMLGSGLVITALEIVVGDPDDDDADENNRRVRRTNGIPEVAREARDDDSMRTGSELRLRSDGPLNGKVEVEFDSDEEETEQELKIELRGAASGDELSIVVLIGDETVALGTFSGNALGLLEVEVEITDEGSGERETELETGPGTRISSDLEALLLALDGRDVRAITGVRILSEGVTVLEGRF